MNAREHVICAAVDSMKQACAVQAKENSRWCPRHDEERKKLYAGYKSQHAALDAFPDETLCRNTKMIKNCTSHDVVRGWSQLLRTKYKLLNRCIQARAYFTQRFFGNDMDFGHKSFWHSLGKQRDEIKNLLEIVEQRAYELLLASQNAMWVLEQPQDDPEAAGEDCAGRDEEPLMKVPIRSPTKDEEVEDPLDVAIREKKEELWEKIWTRLARYCAPQESKYHEERTAIIWACVCRAIYTDPTLMLTAQNYVFITSMLSDSKLDLTMVEKLWNAIKGLYVHEVRAAIDDVLQPVRQTGEYVVVFGTRVHKELSGVGLPFHGWGHMTAIFPCYSCVRKVCKTVDDIVALTRFAILSGGGLAQSNIKYEFDYEGCRDLSLCGFIPNTIEDFGTRNQIEKGNGFINHKPLWTETRSNNVICAGLSLTDSKSQLFVNGCLRHPDLMVMCRKGPDGIKIRSGPLVGAYTRKSGTRAGLAKISWESTMKDAVFFRDSILEECAPLIGPNQAIQECFQVAIVDDGEGGIEDFINKLVKIWHQVYEVDDLRGLLSHIGNPFLDNGELEIQVGGKRGLLPLVHNSELDILLSYRRLWGRGPREGKLVDDETDVEVVAR